MMVNSYINILLSQNTFILLLSDFIILLLQCSVLYIVLQIISKWNLNSYTSFSFKLENRSYFAMLIIYFTTIVKILLYPYFIYTLDTISSIIPGAMCGAGVISANLYGEKLLILKTIILFVGGVWIVINNLDIKQKHTYFMINKSKVYIVLFVLLSLEFFYEILFFTHLSTIAPVTCCSAIYNTNATNPLPFSINTFTLLILFYGSFIITFYSNIKQKYIISFFSSIIFIYIAYYAVIYFFGPYIYDLPTHHCPFCMLQKDYYFVGYFIFGSLFLAVFYGVLNFILYITIKKTIKKYYQYSNLFLIFFILLTFSYLNY